MNTFEQWILRWSNRKENTLHFNLWSLLLSGAHEENERSAQLRIGKQFCRTCLVLIWLLVIEIQCWNLKAWCSSHWDAHKPACAVTATWKLILRAPTDPVQYHHLDCFCNRNDHAMIKLDLGIKKSITGKKSTFITFDWIIVKHNHTHLPYICVIILKCSTKFKSKS